jgi:hypothetical protein
MLMTNGSMDAVPWQKLVSVLAHVHYKAPDSTVQAHSVM